MTSSPPPPVKRCNCSDRRRAYRHRIQRDRRQQQTTAWSASSIHGVCGPAGVRLAGSRDPLLHRAGCPSPRPERRPVIAGGAVDRRRRLLRRRHDRDPRRGRYQRRSDPDRVTLELAAGYLARRARRARQRVYDRDLRPSVRTPRAKGAEEIRQEGVAGSEVAKDLSGPSATATSPLPPSVPTRTRARKRIVSRAQARRPGSAGVVLSSDSSEFLFLFVRLCSTAPPSPATCGVWALYLSVRGPAVTPRSTR